MMKRGQTPIFNMLMMKMGVCPLFIILLNLPLYAQRGPTASDAWATMPSSGAVAVYATINNPSMYEIYVTAATSEVAGRAELTTGDKPATSFTVPAYESLELKPGGSFVRLTDLKSELKAGDEIKLTLTTDGGDQIAVTAVVKAP
jgi:copper(I)-binding protein